MSGEKSELMGVCRTLQTISRQANHVQVTCPSFRFGPTVLSLDARMRSVQLENTGERLTISWLTSDGLGGKMSLDSDVTYQKSLILSPSDPRVIELRYGHDDKFFLKDQSDQWQIWADDMMDKIAAHKVIVNIESYEIEINGEVGYRLSFVSPAYKWYWWVPPSMLDTDFIYLGKQYEKARFLMLDE